MFFLAYKDFFKINRPHGREFFYIMTKKANNMKRDYYVRPARNNGVALVTGAGQGLGRALSVELSRRGLRIAGVGRNFADLAETKELCVEGRFTPYRGDVSQPAEMRELAARAIADVGPVSIIINNAAIYHRKDFLRATAEDIVDHVMINCCGPMNVTTAFLPSLIKYGKGRIINVSSFAGDSPLPGSMGYAVSKAGMRVFSKALAAELSMRLPNITVTEWIPGIMATRSGCLSGLAPEIVAKWGVTLALDESIDLHGTTFLLNAEVLPSRSFRRRMLDKLLLKPTPRPRVIEPELASAYDMR